MVMELYLFLAMFLIYVLTAFMVKPHVLNRIWSLAFVVCFAVTAVAIAFIRISGQDVMMSANELNWYYLLYLFGSLSVVLGVINLWMYRGPIFRIFFRRPTKIPVRRKSPSLKRRDYSDFLFFAADFQSEEVFAKPAFFCIEQPAGKVGVRGLQNPDAAGTVQAAVGDFI